MWFCTITNYKCMENIRLQAFPKIGNVTVQLKILLIESWGQVGVAFINVDQKRGNWISLQCFAEIKEESKQLEEDSCTAPRSDLSDGKFMPNIFCQAKMILLFGFTRIMYTGEAILTLSSCLERKYRYLLGIERSPSIDTFFDIKHVNRIKRWIQYYSKVFYLNLLWGNLSIIASRLCYGRNEVFSSFLYPNRLDSKRTASDKHTDTSSIFWL